MNENLNLCEILKNCPKNTKLYCTFVGDVTFYRMVGSMIEIKNKLTFYTFR